MGESLFANTHFFNLLLNYLFPDLLLLLLEEPLRLLPEDLDTDLVELLDPELTLELDLGELDLVLTRELLLEEPLLVLDLGEVRLDDEPILEEDLDERGVAREVLEVATLVLLVPVALLDELIVEPVLLLLETDLLLTPLPTEFPLLFITVTLLFIALVPKNGGQ